MVNIEEDFGKINYAGKDKPDTENILDTFNKINYPFERFNIKDSFDKINYPNKVVDITEEFKKLNFAGTPVTTNIVDIFKKINYPFETVNIVSAFEEINHPSKPFDIQETFKKLNYPSSKSKSQSEPIVKGPKTELVIEDGAFLRRAVLTMWAFFLFNAICLTAGAAPKREKVEEEKGIELPTVTPRDNVEKPLETERPLQTEGPLETEGPLGTDVDMLDLSLPRHTRKNTMESPVPKLFIHSRQTSVGTTLGNSIGQLNVD